LLGTSHAVAAPVETFDIDAFWGSAVPSDGPQGDFNNVLATFTAGASYTLGDITWSGTAELVEDPDNAGEFPSFAGDMHARVSHTNAATSAVTRYDVMLAHGATFPGQITWNGTSPHLRGLEIATGDTIEFEIFDAHDNLADWPDAQWNNLDITFTDDNNAPPEPTPGVAPGFIRFAAVGQDTFPTLQLNAAGDAIETRDAWDGSAFWRVSYADEETPSGAPTIDSFTIDLGDPSVLSFDEGDIEGAFYTIFHSGWIDAFPGEAFSDVTPGYPFGWGEWTLDFTNQTESFGPGDSVFVGHDIDGAPFEASELPGLAEPIQIILSMSDGSERVGALTEVGYTGFVELTDDEGNPTNEFTSNYFAYVDIPVEQMVVLEADFDMDGDVDGDDFLLWQGGFGQFAGGGATKMDGDYDNDGDVDGDDFLGWQTEFGQSVPGSASGQDLMRSLQALFGTNGMQMTTAAVPEPSAVSLVILGLLAAVATRRR
jgi:hypothetical protein